MDTDNKVPKLARLQNDVVNNVLKPNSVSAWIQWLATGLTVVSCILYVGLFSLISKYQGLVVETVRELPLATRIMLNIYQPFLVVFMIVSVSLWILCHLSMKTPGSRCKLLLVLIILNCVVAATLLGISYVKIN